MKVYGFQSDIIVDGIPYIVGMNDDFETNHVISDEEGISAYDAWIGEFVGDLYTMTEEEVANEIRALLTNNKQQRL